MLKETSKTLCLPLSILFNRSMHENTYPCCWKKANVMPLFKKGNKDMPSNYRPISLISCVGKIMERVVFKHIYNHLITNNLIYKNQSGFLPGHSTIYQLIDIYNQICKAFDDKKSTCIVFCDISKAFDRVWHKGLMFKLRQNGIRGNLLKWLASYLINRSQRVFVGSTFSNEKNINAGVPQGSVLGPLLFLIYVNDIAHSMLSTVRLFADDSSLAISTSDINHMELTLNSDLTNITEWSKQWLVQFNPAKTEVIFLSLSNTCKPVLFFQDSQLNFVHHHKHLGLTFSDNGTWHDHISNIISSASKVLGSMRMLKFKIKRVTINQIYISYLRPILEYASIVWDNCAQYEKDTLERLQYDAARVVTGLTRSVSIERLLREIGWVSLSDRRKMQKLILVYKYKHENLPSYLNELFPETVNEANPYNLRNNNNFTALARRTEIYAQSVIPSAVKLWNDLNLDIRELTTLSSFKLKLKEIFKPQSIPHFFLVGDRSEQIYHARIRNRCSNLNSDLYHNHLKNNPACDCGNEYEDAEHFFFQCPLFANQRHVLFINTRRFHPLSTGKLIYGNETLSDDDNACLFKEVQIFIKQTHRFQ